jgi:hypothetical protein
MIKSTNYHSHTSFMGQRKPLMIGCSGGGGHISAIMGLHHYFQSAADLNYQATDHFPIQHHEMLAKHQTHHARKEFQLGLQIMHDSWYSDVAKWATQNLTYFPVLPNPELLEAEIQTLSKRNPAEKARPYVDMLLDSFPAGFESAAIWNVLQRHDKIKMLKRAVALQQRSDETNYAVVKQNYIKLLKQAARAGQPYTEIVSTQAMCLPALCDAVIEYNKWLLTRHGRNKGPQVTIHQYLTDLPTDGAVHYINALNKLSPAQQKVMKLYGCGLTEKFVNKCQPTQNDFAGVYNIPPEENPMVRPGFRCRATSLHDKWDRQLAVSYIDYQPDGKVAPQSATRTIQPNDQVASIMLGSQASLDTIKYVQSLLNAKYDHIFVFGAKTPAIAEQLESLINDYPLAQRAAIRRRIIPLGNQTDIEMQPIMTRSNSVFIRGGGLSVMEQMAMRHNVQQTIFVHHSDPAPMQKLSSGISWEDENVNSLIDFLAQKGVVVNKTSPKLSYDQLLQARANAIKSEYKLSFSHVTKEREFFERVNHIYSTLSPELIKKYHHAIFSSHTNINAISKLISAGGHLNDAIISLSVSPNMASKINILSYFGSRSIAYLFMVSQTNPSPEFSFKNKHQAVTLLFNFYKFLDNNPSLLSDPEVNQTKKVFFHQITKQFPLGSIDYLIKHQPSRSIANMIRLNFLEHRCQSLKTSLSQQNKLTPNTSETVTAKELLHGIRTLIETVDFPTGWFGGNRISYEDQNGKLQSNVVPRNMMRIWQEIVKAEHQQSSPEATLSTIQKIIDEKISSDNQARSEYFIFRDRFFSTPTQPQETEDYLTSPANKPSCWPLQ